MTKRKLIRITTVPLSLEKLLENQLRFMKEFYNVTAISSEKNRLTQFGKEQGINTYHIELTRKITPLKDIKAVFKLYKFLKKEKPFIVHTHTPKAGIVGMIAAYLAKVPNRLHTVAGLPLLESTGFKRKILNIVEKLTYKCATKIYPNSFGLKDIIIENKFVNKEKLKIIANGSSNGINTSYFNPNLFSEEQKKKLKIKLGIYKEDFVFIFVGRIVGDKGINELIAAFDKLSKEKENIKLLMVGGLEDDLDPLKVGTKKTIKRNKRIIFTGFQKDVRLYFAISDTLVFPSYREGFPNVVMQAGAMNLPSIVTNINGCNEIIKNNINGKIIPVKDAKSLYKEMIFFIENRKDIQEMKNKARNIIVDNYQSEVVWKSLLNEYQSLEF